MLKLLGEVDVVVLVMVCCFSCCRVWVDFGGASHGMVGIGCYGMGWIWV